MLEKLSCDISLCRSAGGPEVTSRDIAVLNTPPAVWEPFIAGEERSMAGDGQLGPSDGRGTRAAAGEPDMADRACR